MEYESSVGFCLRSGAGLAPRGMSFYERTVYRVYNCTIVSFRRPANQKCSLNRFFRLINVNFEYTIAVSISVSQFTRWRHTLCPLASLTFFSSPFLHLPLLALEYQLTYCISALKSLLDHCISDWSKRRLRKTQKRSHKSKALVNALEWIVGAVAHGAV